MRRLFWERPARGKNGSDAFRGFSKERNVPRNRPTGRGIGAVAGRYRLVAAATPSMVGREGYRADSLVWNVQPFVPSTERTEAGLVLLQQDCRLVKCSIVTALKQASVRHSRQSSGAGSGPAAVFAPSSLALRPVRRRTPPALRRLSTGCRTLSRWPLRPSTSPDLC